MPARKRRHQVHLTFEPHPKGQRPTIDYKVRTILFETAIPLAPHEKLDAGSARARGERDRYLRDALLRRKRVVAGETATQSEYFRLSRQNNRRQTALNRAIRQPTTANIRMLFLTDSHFHALRHRLIRQTIKQLITKKELPAQGYYGNVHSLLSAELKREGVLFNRKVAPQVFTHATELTRRLMRGVSPRSISSTAYKRAFLSEILGQDVPVAHLLGKKTSDITPEDAIFFAHVQRALIGRMSEAQCDQLIAKVLVNKGDMSSLLEANGLPPNPTRKELEKFIRKKSHFYRRLHPKKPKK